MCTGAIYFAKQLISDGTGFFLKNCVMFRQHRGVSESCSLIDHPLHCVNEALTEAELPIMVALTRTREATRIGGGCAKQTDRLEPALRLLATSPFSF